MSSLYILGARRRKLVLKDETEWNLYEAALILQLDTSSGMVRTCVEYETPADARPNQSPSSIFKSGSLVGDTLYACTKTEILLFRVPEFQRVHYVSLACFNDVHHVAPGSDGSLLVANTGLDMVASVSLSGELKAAWNVLGEPVWSRFSSNVDYRKIETTKPHKAHPNYVFELDGELWVTRFHQRDAICLHDPKRRIHIAVEKPHEGILVGEQVYFTVVDGRIAIASAREHTVERVIDLKMIDGQDALLGWCRGLLPLDARRVWVGFSRIRRTWYQENVHWVKNVLREGMREKPTHIALYDLAQQRCLQEFDLEAHGMHVVFSIFPALRPAVV